MYIWMAKNKILNQIIVFNIIVKSQRYGRYKFTLCPTFLTGTYGGFQYFTRSV